MDASTVPPGLQELVRLRPGIRGVSCNFPATLARRPSAPRRPTRQLDHDGARVWGAGTSHVDVGAVPGATGRRTTEHYPRTTTTVPAEITISHARQSIV